MLGVITLKIVMLSVVAPIQAMVETFLSYNCLPIFQVLSWVVYGGLFSYVKVSIVGRCRQRSTGSLFYCGVVTQAGSAVGALLAFLLVNVASNVFVGYYVQC
jgi:hypothetical protein